MELIDKENFAKDFIEQYTKRGFGSMNKNDFEVLIFDLLSKYGNLKSKSNYQASLLLQIPESKIKRLSYEADLKYGNKELSDISIEFFRIVANSKLRADQSKVQFVIENQFIRSSISAKLKELGHFSDSSFNSEVVSVHIDSFIDLLEYFYPKSAIERIVKDCKKSVKVEKGEEITFKLIMKKFLEGFVSQTGKKTVDLGVAYFTGGLENIPSLVKGIKQKLTPVST